VTEQMNHLAEGDLTRDHINLKTNDETGQLAKAMNHMQDRLKNIITKVSFASDQLSSQSEELTQSASEVKAGANQVATTMSELASGSETQATQTSELSANMQRFAEGVDQASENGAHIESASSNVLKLTDEGTALMDASKTQMV
ncbi:HAMP domain-containing protein, partial [Lentibacillus saliphilus]|uniref:HAMP domain-containing protein n=1 Tax=Lentibacillus saliphilus TaxID=2737028 RepID=UPI001C2FD531